MANASGLHRPPQHIARATPRWLVLLARRVLFQQSRPSAAFEGVGIAGLTLADVVVEAAPGTPRAPANFIISPSCERVALRNNTCYGDAGGCSTGDGPSAQLD